jgi:hypothetical protein
LGLKLNRLLSIQGTYSWYLPINVEVGVPSKKLVSQDDFAIRCPYLTLLCLALKSVSHSSQADF